ncbi:hypothetical protein [Spirosoma rhododendri]|uniref:TonB-dependent receptor plug domain-containing protein n=1 Tax=Spirosoma rhododendri TaxID=2728024 RepID=A0A7L5DMA0_9BACT|nr:hypothetical protein [Spirosoma rhododendri]QJD79604.1 hypothetical protein HH216_15145 [Spirosoma rhododendri]
MKTRILVLLIACSGFSLTTCSQVSNGVPPTPAANAFLKGANGPPLWFVDNVEVAAPQKKGKPIVDPNDIQTVTVLSPDSNNDLISRYGEKGKNGVVLVTTKKGEKKQK